MNQVAATHPDRDELVAFSHGRLADASWATVEEHVANCEVCRAMVESSPDDPLETLLRRATDGSPAATARLRLVPGFEIIEEIGRGGMGVVYKARQQGLNRLVALKQIRTDTVPRPADVARLRREAEAIARLRHPNIVQIHEVGEQDGQPYLALEFVEGGSLDKRLAGTPLAPRAAAALVETLARAVQHAHEQGIVHRDLKPANVLLEAVERGALSVEGQNEEAGDARPISLNAQRSTLNPRITDFGLAKCLDQSFAQTQTGDLMGTPSYMAPEQAAGRTSEIGPASDIYALGAILYETLTGRPPFKAATVLETLRQIATTDPVAPARLQPGVPRDLDVICLKCLGKDPRRRYATAAELADDLARHLAGEPIRARAVTAPERLLKWARRRPAAAALVAFAVLATIGLVAGTLWHNRRLQAEVKRANANEAIALANFRSGYDALDQVLKELEAELPDTAAGRQLRVHVERQSLDYFYGVFKNDDESNPKTRLARGMLLLYAGNVLAALEESEQAMRDLAESHRLLQSIPRGDPDFLQAQEYLALCCHFTAEASHSMEHPVEAERLYRESIDIQTALAAAEANIPRLDYRQARSYLMIARLLLRSDRAEQAVPLFQAAITHAESSMKAFPTDAGIRHVLADACRLLGFEHTQNQRWSEAESCFRQAEVALASGGGDAMSPKSRAVLGGVYVVWAFMELSRGSLDEALRRSDQGIAVVDALLAVEPTDKLGREVLEGLKHNKAQVLVSLDRADEATALSREPVQSGDDPKSEELLLANARLAAAIEHRQHERWTEATATLHETETALFARADAAHSARAKRALADVYFEWGETEIGRGRLDDAVERYDQGIAILFDLHDQAPADHDVRSTLSFRCRLKAWHLSRAGRTDGAFAAWDQAVKYAIGGDRDYLRTERALERALFGDHAGALNEANRVASAADLAVMTLVHLARVYSRAIDAAERDESLDEAARARAKSDCAARAVSCLRRVHETHFESPDWLNELDADEPLAALRATDVFRAWRATLPREKG